MPTIKVPLAKFTDFPKLRKLRSILTERVQLYEDQKRAELRLKGDEKQGVVGLNYDLFGELRMVLPADVKSFEFEHEGERYQISCIVGENGRKTLDRQALIETPFEVSGKCKCGKKVVIETTIPPSLIEECTKEGAVPEPTVSVTRLKGDGQ